MNNREDYSRVVKIGNGIHVYDNRARRVLKEIANAWVEGHKGLGIITPPEKIYRPDWMQDGLSRTDEQERHKANFVYLQGFSQRSGKSASTILGNLHRWWEKDPTLFDPLRKLEETPAFAQMVLEVDPQSTKGKHFRELDWWQAVMRRLREEHAGDARTLVYQLQGGPPSFYYEVCNADMSNWEEVNKLRKRFANYLRTFKGVELKVASMIAIFFQEVAWQEYPEFWERFNRIPFVPFDVHHIRSPRQLDLIADQPGQSSRITLGDRDYVGPPLSDYWSQICFEEGIPHHALAQAIFNTGAITHLSWAREKDAYEQARICAEQCVFHEHCKFIVKPAGELNTKKRKRSVISGSYAECITSKMTVCSMDITPTKPSFFWSGAKLARKPMTADPSGLQKISILDQKVPL